LSEGFFILNFLFFMLDEKKAFFQARLIIPKKTELGIPNEITENFF